MYMPHLAMETPTLLNIPSEVRLMIYSYLFDDGGNQRLSIRNEEESRSLKLDLDIRRTRYWILDRSFQRKCYETTYHLKRDDNIKFCAELMRTNRKIYQELSYEIYGKHSFDFGSDIEAVQPFLTDLTPQNRKLIRELSLYKRGPVALYEQDRSEWRSLCRYLSRERDGSIRKLRLVVQGGKPAVPWEGPKEFTASDFKLLADIKHECLDWVAELAQVKGIEELEVLPDVQYCPPPVSTSMIIFAAFSASIEKGLTEFLRKQLTIS